MIEFDYFRILVEGLFSGHRGHMTVRVAATAMYVRVRVVSLPIVKVSSCVLVVSHQLMIS
jgi:hypothetical protein